MIVDFYYFVFDFLFFFSNSIARLPSRHPLNKLNSDCSMVVFDTFRRIVGFSRKKKNEMFVFKKEPKKKNLIN